MTLALLIHNKQTLKCCTSTRNPTHHLLITIADGYETVQGRNLSGTVRSFQKPVEPENWTPTNPAKSRFQKLGKQKLNNKQKNAYIRTIVLSLNESCYLTKKSTMGAYWEILTKWLTTLFRTWSTCAVLWSSDQLGKSSRTPPVVMTNRVGLIFGPIPHCDSQVKVANNTERSQPIPIATNTQTRSQS